MTMVSSWPWAATQDKICVTASAVTSGDPSVRTIGLTLVEGIFYCIVEVQASSLSEDDIEGKGKRDVLQRIGGSASAGRG